jgi:uncharacterized YccA/Bax inhibitor family protein
MMTGVISVAPTLTWFDVAGFTGVLLIVIAYLLLQLDKLRSAAPRYSLLNAGGALLIILSLIFKFNLSAFISCETQLLARNFHSILR